MSKRLCTLAAVVLVAAPGVAAAKEKIEPRVQAVMACESVAASDARLQCFDQAAAGLKQALDRGTMVLKETKGPTAREGVVTASGTSGANRFWVVLDSGDRWTLLPKTVREAPPAPGTRLKAKKTLWGRHWISGPGWSESEAEFVGRGE